MDEPQPNPYVVPDATEAKFRGNEKDWFVAKHNQWTAVYLPICVGLASGAFGILGALVHLFLIDTDNQLAFHFVTTLPFIGTMFLLSNAFANYKSTREVRLHAEGVETIEVGKSKMTPWTEIKEVSLKQSSSIGSVGQNIVRLLDGEGDPLVKISGNFESMENLANSIRAVGGIAETSESEKRAPSSSARRAGKRNAILMAGGALLMTAGAIFLPYDAWQKSRFNHLLETEAIDGQGVVTKAYLAPNGRTCRMEYEVKGETGEVGSRNVEVTRTFFEQISQGDSVDVKFVPQEPSINQLRSGEVVSDDITQKPMTGYLMGVFMAFIGVFLWTMMVISWKGYDVDFTNGKFKLTTLE